MPKARKPALGWTSPRVRASRGSRVNSASSANVKRMAGYASHLRASAGEAESANQHRNANL